MSPNDDIKRNKNTISFHTNYSPFICRTHFFFLCYLFISCISNVPIKYFFIIKLQPLYFPDNSPDGQKLNVEEKKPRARTNDMPPRQNMGGSGMNNMNNNQRNMSSGGPPSRSLSNSGSGGGSMMRGNSVGNNSSMSRGGSSGGGGAGPRMGGAFNRNDNRTSNGGSGSQMRGGNNSQTQGNSYGVRR